MALTAVQRLVSNAPALPVVGQPVYYADTQTGAIARAQGGGTFHRALAAEHPDPDVWPELAKFNDDPNFPGVPNPIAIWGPSTASGQTYWFATKSGSVPTSATPEILITLTAFCDNAIEAQYFIYDFNNTLAVTGTLLTDGVFDADAGTTTDRYPPYNWQKVRFYSNLVTTGLTAGAYYIVFTFHGMNYNVAYGPNPAGLAFVADVYSG